MILKANPNLDTSSQNPDVYG